MPISASDFQFSIGNAPLSAVLGKDTLVDLYSSNTNPVDACYNLSIVVTLPDGVSFVDATVPPTDQVQLPDGSIVVSFINIKDLAHNEMNYDFRLRLMSDVVFRSTGLPVPVGVPILSVVAKATVDTLPRGNEDPGNVVISDTHTSSFTPLEYNLTKSAPGKMPKGAGELAPPIDPMWIYTYQLVLSNNTELPSVVTLVDQLPNGVRYLNQLVVSGPDAAILSNPTVLSPTLGQDFYVLDWGNVQLSAGSNNVITFQAAIWDNSTVDGVENSGGSIPHGSPLVNQAQLSGVGGVVTAAATTAAMDLTIDKSVSPQNTNIGQTLSYTLRYRVNQYDPIDGVVITDVLSDGQQYVNGSASVLPTNITNNPDGTTTLEWDLGNLDTGTTGTITFQSVVLPSYINGNPVVSDDHLPNHVNADGTNVTKGTPTPDNSSSDTAIGIPQITKKVLQYYYNNGTPKPMSVASPGDLVEFEIDFASYGLAGVLDLLIDEYPPLNMGPVNSSLPVQYSGTIVGSFAPQNISPNGLRWSLGDIPNGGTWGAKFKIPVLNLPVVGTRYNLAKLSGQNTPDFNYSDRDQVPVYFGKPNISFKKTLTPAGQYLIPGNTYQYTVTIGNLQNGTGLVTDAYNMSLTDIIPAGMTLTGTYTVTGTGSYLPPVFSGQNISMKIVHLAPGQQLVFKYNVIVTGGVAAGSILKNNAILTQPDAQADGTFPYPGSPFTASVSRQLVPTTLNKTSSVSVANVGEDITYTITLVVPRGTLAYAPQITDTLPVGETYIGPATVQTLPAAPTTVVPAVTGQSIVFPPHADISATSADVIVLYQFVARVTNATHQPPYEETQQNVAKEKWFLNPQGTSFLETNASSQVEVTTPHISLLKEQRDYTIGTPYTTDQMILSENGILAYRLTVVSDGAGTAYNVNIIDILDPYVVFQNFLAPPNIGTAVVSGASGEQRILWTIPVFPVNQTAVLEYAVKPFTVTPTFSILNRYGGTYASYNTSAAQVYTMISNTVAALAPNLGFYKSVSKGAVFVGEKIRYEIHLVIPPGIVAYNIKIEDILPKGQKFAGNARRNEQMVQVFVTGQTISFPEESVLGPFGKVTRIVYSFDAEILFDPTTPEITTETNEARLQWSLTPIDPDPDPEVSVSQINITISKKVPVRGFTTGEVKDAEEIISTEHLDITVDNEDEKENNE